MNKLLRLIVLYKENDKKLKKLEQMYAAGSITEEEEIDMIDSMTRELKNNVDLIITENIKEN